MLKPAVLARLPLALTLLAPILLAGGSAVAARPIGPDDIARVAAVSDPQVDPSGLWVAYTVAGTDVAADKGFSHVWMTSWDGARSVALTGRAKESENTPRFSPDGRWLTFVSSRGDEKHDDQLWLMDRAGGEGQPLAGLVGSVTDYAWSPDSKTLAIVVEDPDPDRVANAAAEAVIPSPDRPGVPPPPGAPPAAVAPTAAGDKDKPPKPIVIDRFQFKQDIDGYLGKKRQRLFLYDLAGHKARRLTTGDFDEALPAWAPDGRSLAFVSKRGPDPDRSDDSNLYLAAVGATPAEPVRLTAYEGEDNPAQSGSPLAWSPDSREIAYVQGGPVKLIGYGVRRLAVVPAAGGPARVLTATLDRNVSNPVWARDGKSIRALVEDDEAQRIVQVPAAGGAVAEVAGGWRKFSSLRAGPGGALAALLSTPTAPTEVYVLDAAGQPRQLTHQNDAWLKEVEVAPTVRTRFKSRDGTEVHGFLVTPPHAVAGQRLPTMLFSHGGPQSQNAAEFSLQWQIFAGHGLAVVAPNFRGGTGRGEAYAKAIYADWGSLSVQDALAAVDDAVARGVADPNRLVLGGWSYGGILTNYVIASDKRFKAAVSGASISNVLAGYGTDQYIRDYETELGRPWENPKAWMKISYPFFHNEKIVTPTLFMAGDKDFNVPLLNSEQMYQALRSRGVDTGLVIYPGEFHGLKRPSFLKDRMQRWLDWYDTHLGKQP
jgi:dipeptidyl aminopeptidase/acylaminoacyl peptidase